MGAPRRTIALVALILVPSRPMARQDLRVAQVWVEPEFCPQIDRTRTEPRISRRNRMCPRRIRHPSVLAFCCDRVGHASSAKTPIHAARARPDPHRDAAAFRAGSAVGQWPVSAHLARRPAEGPAEDSFRHPSMLDRGLVEIRRNPMGRPAAFFTEAGLEGLRQLLQDRQVMKPERFAHLRRELGMGIPADGG
jgi:hypothetical protein